MGTFAFLISPRIEIHCTCVSAEFYEYYKAERGK